MKLVWTAVVQIALLGTLSLFAPDPAEAITCGSACNQIRRACIAEAKAVVNVAFADCDDSHDACRTTCDADPTACQSLCQNANDTCLAACPTAPDPALCQSECAAALAACPTECPACCKAARSTCRDSAKADRTETKLFCSAARASCNTVCTEPIDPGCVRGCMADQKDCRSAAKSFERACKNSCVTGSSRRACFRDCRRQTAAGYEICSNQEALCIGGCIGIVTP